MSRIVDYKALTTRVNEGKATEAEKKQLKALADQARWLSPDVQAAQDALAADSARDK